MKITSREAEVTVMRKILFSAVILVVAVLATSCNEGRLDVAVNANHRWDSWTSGGYWQQIDANYDQMIVFEPYWDSRLAAYDDVYVYRDSYGVQADDPRAVEHPEWILRDAAGNPVFIPWGCGGGTCPQYAADVGHAGYRADFVEYVRGLVGRGYTGLFLDDVNMAWRFGKSDGSRAEPINPRTGEVMVLADWQRDMSEFLELIRSEFPELEIVHNVIWYSDSPGFSNSFVDRQIVAADVLSLEWGATDAGLVGGTGTFGMETFFAFIDHAHSLGTSVMMRDRTATSVDGQVFNLAAALLVNEGNDMISTADQEMIGPDSFWAGFETDLGTAQGPRRIEDGIIRRDFTGGAVLLNQPGRPSMTVSLDAPMRTHDGAVVTSVTLGSREAAVLTSTD